MNMTYEPSFFFILLSFLMFPAIHSKKITEGHIKKIATFILMILFSPLFLFIFFSIFIFYLSF